MWEASSVPHFSPKTPKATRSGKFIEISGKRHWRQEETGLQGEEGSGQGASAPPGPAGGQVGGADLGF